MKATILAGGLLVFCFLMALVGAWESRRLARRDRMLHPPALALTEEQKRKTAEARAEAAKRAAKAEAQWRLTPAGKACAGHADWNREVCQVIAERKIRIGMTREQVRASWGRPEQINSTMRRDGITEQWVYPRDYLYFDQAGIVETIQSSR